MMKQRIRDYQLEVIDKNNYQVRKVKKIDAPDFPGATKEVFGSATYYSRIEHAVEFIVRQTADMVDGGLDQWLMEYREVKSELLDLINQTKKENPNEKE